MSTEIEMAFLQLDGAIRDRLEQEFQSRDKSQRQIYNDAVRRHLVKVMRGLTATGFALPPAERGDQNKSRLKPQRRKIDAVTWRLLGEAAELVDVSRQDLLRAVLRLELGLREPVSLDGLEAGVKVLT